MFQHSIRNSKHALSVTHRSSYNCLATFSWLGQKNASQQCWCMHSIAVLMGEGKAPPTDISRISKEGLTAFIWVSHSASIQMVSLGKNLRLTFFFCEMAIMVNDPSELSGRRVKIVGMEAVCKNGTMEILLLFICIKTTGVYYKVLQTQLTQMV